ncbi:hypothetical protein, partial [Streptomyces sp.]|uniref:hypothetical protein n=1 Tax=Streptomyces sp. TaxID=1931 RepID=UPI00281239FA
MRSSRHGRTPVRIAALAVAATVGTGMLTALPASAEVEDTASSIGWYRPSDGSFHLNDAVAADDASDRAFVYGPAGDGTLTAVSGDWDGDRASSVGWYRPSDGSWHLTNATTSGATTHYAFVYGPAGDASVTPVVGDWDGDGKDSVGWYRPGDGSWHLTNAMTSGASTHHAFVYGPAGDASVTPVAGDWDADGKDSVGWYRPGDGSWHLTNKRDTPSSSDVALVSGPAGDATVQPVVGDWDGYVPPVVPPSNPAPPAVTGQQAAADLLASGRVTGADGVMAQIRGVASGQPYTDVRVCHLDPTLLGVLRTLVVERGYSLYVTSFNRYCTDTLTGSGQA